MKKIIIAIDGYSSCGKSTMAKDLARHIGYVYVDTGAMYRAVTLYAMRHHLFNANGSVQAGRLRQLLPGVEVSFRLDKTTGMPVTLLDGQPVESEIRSLEVSAHVSTVAALPFVREAMVAQQQRMGEDKGIVMDGRDIGTTVFPQAELKVFVTASSDVRARRRFDELKAKGMPASLEDIKRNVEQRDYADTHRPVSPLRKAPDAIVLDNTNMTVDEQNQWLMQRYEEKAGDKPPVR